MPWHSFSHNCVNLKEIVDIFRPWKSDLFLCFVIAQQYIVFSFFFSTTLRQEILVAWKFCGFLVEIWNPRNWNATSSTAKLKCRKIKSLGQNIKLKCRKKNLFKTSSVKKQCYKNAFLCLASLKLFKIELIFQK